MLKPIIGGYSTPKFHGKTFVGGSKTAKFMIMNVFSDGCLPLYSIFNNVMYFAHETTVQDSNTILFLHTHIKFGNSPLIVEKILIFW